MAYNGAEAQLMRRLIASWRKMYSIYPPTQKTPVASPGMNALDGPSVARNAKEGEFRRWRTLLTSLN